MRQEADWRQLESGPPEATPACLLEAPEAPEGIRPRGLALEVRYSCLSPLPSTEKAASWGWRSLRRLKGPEVGLGLGSSPHQGPGHLPPATTRDQLRKERPQG